MASIAPPNATPPFQFTLRQLLAAMTAICVATAAICWLPVPLGFVTVLLAAIVGAAAWFAIKGNFGAAGIALAAVLLIPILFSPLAVPREQARRASCQNNLHNIILALQHYHTVNGSYPPPYSADAAGKPMHSWRVLLLPYLEQKALYNKYRFDEPWDGPNNSKLHDIELKIFQCPSQENPRPNTETSYVVVLGTKTPWPTESPYPIRDADIIDGPSNTILVVEVANSGIHWMEPRDLHINQMPMVINARRGQGISSHHPGGAMIGFADGGIRFLRNELEPEPIRAALTRNGKDNNQLGPLRDGQ